MNGKKLNPYEVSQREQAESRERDRQFQAEMRERAKQTAQRMAEQDAQAAREQAAADEAAFRADELQKYLAAGGTEFQFNQDWYRLRQQKVEQRYFSNTPAPLPETAAAAKRRLDLLYRKPGGE